MNNEIYFLTLADKKLAYQQRRRAGDGADENKSGVIFFGGYGSDMTGTKAGFLAECCAARDIDFTRFDYQGHGRSSGAFVDGTIGQWRQDALDILDHLTTGPQILVGSSMGGWIGLLLALARPARIAGFVGVAAAPDFTETIVPDLTPPQREALYRDGLIYDDDAPPDFRLPMTLKLIEEGRRHLVLNAPLPLAIPMHLLQGQQDDAVPWATALRLAETVTGADIRITLIKDGDHRLSRPQDLALLEGAVMAMATIRPPLSVML